MRILEIIISKHSEDEFDKILNHDIDKPVSLSVNYILMIILSFFVAGIGILKNNVAIIIGAMVIAPFLGPTMSLAFGTTLGDLPIIKKSILTALVGTLITFYLAGIRPRRWWEKEEAKKKTRSAFVVWTLALLFLIIAIMLLSKYG